MLFLRYSLCGKQAAERSALLRRDNSAVFDIRVRDSRNIVHHKVLTRLDAPSVQRDLHGEQLGKLKVVGKECCGVLAGLCGNYVHLVALAHRRIKGAFPAVEGYLRRNARRAAQRDALAVQGKAERLPRPRHELLRLYAADIAKLEHGEPAGIQGAYFPAVQRDGGEVVLHALGSGHCNADGSCMLRADVQRFRRGHAAYHLPGAYGYPAAVKTQTVRDKLRQTRQQTRQRRVQNK